MNAKPHLKTTNFAFRFERKKCCTERERARDREQHKEERERGREQHREEKEVIF
jgi:hypothetical protein